MSLVRCSGSRSCQLGEQLAGSGDDQRARPVVGRHGEPRLGADGPLDHVEGGRDRHHAAPARDAGDGTAAQGHDPGRVGQGEGADDGGGGDLALGVADDHVRFDAVGAPHLGQGDHDRPQGGLDHVHPIQAGGAGPLVQHVYEGVAGVRREGVRALGDARGEDRRRGQQLAGHPGPLRSLPGEDEHPPPAGRGAEQDVVVRPATGQRPQPGHPGLPLRAQHHRTVLEDRPAPHQTGRDPREIGPRLRRHRDEPPRHLPQRLRTPRRHHPRQPGTDTPSPTGRTAERRRRGRGWATGCATVSPAVRAAGRGMGWVGVRRGGGGSWCRPCRRR